MLVLNLVLLIAAALCLAAAAFNLVQSARVNLLALGLLLWVLVPLIGTIDRLA